MTNYYCPHLPYGICDGCLENDTPTTLRTSRSTHRLSYWKTTHTEYTESYDRYVEYHSDTDRCYARARQLRDAGMEQILITVLLDD